jgi:D-alanyl-D-alanine carboxypeptidase
MAGLVNFYLSGMNRAALFEPGTDFHYTDTNYIILGLLIEHISGNSLHHELRERIFDPLGMDHSYLTYSTDPPSSQWEEEVSEFWALGTPAVSMEINFSMDWAAGGVYSTAADLSVYLKALVTGELFETPATLDTLLSYPFKYNETFGYGCGVHVGQEGASIVVQHSGLSGSWMIYHSESDLTFVGTVNEIQSFRFFHVIRRTYRIMNRMGYEMTSPF